MKKRSFQQIEKTTQVLDKFKTKQVKGGGSVIGLDDIIIH